MEKLKSVLKSIAKFILSPHRLVALMLGIGLLAFTQFVVLKPVERVPAVKPIIQTPIQYNDMAMQQSISKEEPALNTVGDTIDYDDMSDDDIDDLYFGDLINDLGAMLSDDVEFSDMKQLNVSDDRSAAYKGKATVAIVIDDLGMNRQLSWDVIELDFPITLAFLPYATGVEEMAKKGALLGHEVILHVPMQPQNDEIDAGSNALRVDDTEEGVVDAIAKNLSTLPTNMYSGINNHMGSAFTQDTLGMNLLMAQLKSKNLYYLDSRTTADSVARVTAQAHDVPFAERDVFLDHEETSEYTKSAFGELERIALENGQAIAIGHPKQITIDGLMAWQKTLSDKNIELVLLRDLVK